MSASALPQPVVAPRCRGLGVQVSVDVESLAQPVAVGLVLVDVLIGTEGADAAGGVGGIVGAGQRGVDVAGEELVIAVGELIVDGDRHVFAHGLVDADVGGHDVGRAQDGPIW